MNNIASNIPTSIRLSLLLLFTTASLVHADASLPRAGLIMHLDSGVGVQQRGTTVSHWWDQSGYGQNLIAAGAPRLIHQSLNGKPVIELAHENDALRQSQPSNLPTLDNDRTLIVLAAATDTGAKLGYGAQGCGEAFGLAKDKLGYTSLAAGCDTPMHTSGKTWPGQWNLHVLIVRSSQYIHLRNGELVDSRNTRIATLASAFEIVASGLQPTGSESSGSNLQVATVLGYNWALGTNELAAVQHYLGSRWFSNKDHYPTPPDMHPLKLPKPQIELQQTTRNNQVEVSWKVSYADGCQADNGWTQSGGTSGRQLITAPQRGASYGLNCWHRTASASASLSTDPHPVTITWQEPPGQQNAATGYRLFVGKQPKNYLSVVQVAANSSNSHTLKLAPGKYYLAMSTVGHEGRESGLSGEIAITVN